VRSLARGGAGACAAEGEDDHDANIDTLSAEALAQLLREHIGGLGGAGGLGGGAGDLGGGTGGLGGGAGGLGGGGGGVGTPRLGGQSGGRSGAATPARRSVLPRDGVFARAAPPRDGASERPQLPGGAAATPARAPSPSLYIARTASRGAGAGAGSGTSSGAGSGAATPALVVSVSGDGGAGESGAGAAEARLSAPSAPSAAAAAAAPLLRELDASLLRAYELASAALRAASPEAPERERLKRLARFTASLLRAQALARRRAAEAVAAEAAEATEAEAAGGLGGAGAGARAAEPGGAARALRALRACVLAQRSALLRALVELLARELRAGGGFGAPEQAALLELVARAHFELLGCYAARGERAAAPPRMRALELLMVGAGAERPAGAGPGAGAKEDNDEDDEGEGEGEGEEDAEEAGEAAEGGDAAVNVGSSSSAGAMPLRPPAPRGGAAAAPGRRLSSASAASGASRRGGGAAARTPRAALVARGAAPAAAPFALPAPLPLPQPLREARGPAADAAASGPPAAAAAPLPGPQRWLSPAYLRSLGLWAAGLAVDEEELGFGVAGGGSGLAALAREPALTAPRLAALLWRRWRPQVFEWAGDYKLRWLRQDVVAGATIGVLLMPQGLAYAGLARQQSFLGLYTGFPAALYALLGTSRQGAVGPQSIPALLIASSLAAVPDAEYGNAVAGVTLLVGLVMLAAGWLRAGFFVRFISRPVLAGFAAGSAILTMTSSAKDLLGVHVPRQALLSEQLASLAAALPAANAPTVGVAAASVLLLLALPRARWSKAVPAPLQVTALAIAAMAIAVAAGGGGGGGGGGGLSLGPGGIELVGRFPTVLPTLALPSISLERLPLLLSTALSVTLVGFIESVAVANTYALKHGYAVSAESELKALGLANIFGASMGALPVMLAFGRSSVNNDCGARTPLAQAVSALTVAVVVLTISPALFYLPRAALAAVICVAVSSLLRVGKQARTLWRADRSDLACLAASFLATAFLGVLYGVSIAMLISVAFFVAASTRATVVELGRLRGTASYAPLGEPGVAPQRVTRVLRFDAPLWFANGETLRGRLFRELAARRHQPPVLRARALVLDFSAVAGVDSTAAEMLLECAAAAAADGAPLLLAAVPPACERELERFGLVAALGGRAAGLWPSVHDAVRAVAAKELRRAAAADLEAEAGVGAAAAGSGAAAAQ